MQIAVVMFNLVLVVLVLVVVDVVPVVVQVVVVTVEDGDLLEEHVVGDESVDVDDLTVQWEA